MQRPPPATTRQVNMVVKRGVNEDSVLPMARFFHGSGHPALHRVHGRRAHERLAPRRRRPRRGDPRRRPGRAPARAARAGLSRRGRPPLALRRRRWRDRRDRLRPALLRGLHARGFPPTARFTPASSRPRATTSALLRQGAGEEEISAAIGAVWGRRTDPYSELRTAATARLDKVRDVVHRRDESARDLPRLARIAGCATPRLLPRGWGDLLFQLSLWFGFILAYQVARGIADRGPLEAFQNPGTFVIDAERALHSFVEADLQGVVHPIRHPPSRRQRDLLAVPVPRCWAWPPLDLPLPHGVVHPRPQLGARHQHHRARRLRAHADHAPDVSGGRVRGHARAVVDAESRRRAHQLASNPYAAMPSVHAADALIVGFAMATLVRSRWAASSGRSGRAGSGSRS